MLNKEIFALFEVTQTAYAKNFPQSSGYRGNDVS